MTEPDVPQPLPSAPRRDWLLTSARLLVTIIMVLVAFVAVLLIGAAIAAPFLPDSVHLRIDRHAIQPMTTGDRMAISALLVVLSGFLAAAFQWLRELRRIIDSVGDGDPFNPINAERLARMGWITVIVELVSIPGGALAAFVAHLFHKTRLEVGLSLGGILMALVLFILARVFREGARMREDLEGTV
jgi:hypothetical protein